MLRIWENLFVELILASHVIILMYSLSIFSRIWALWSRLTSINTDLFVFLMHKIKVI